MADGPVLDEGAEFERHRRYLSAVAYRLLGSLADAEDAVQDAWLRWQSVDHSTVRDPRAFLTTVVTRICYDLLGSARVQREAYFGEWLPEPSITVDDAGSRSPEDAAALGESVSYAMLAVMEQLSPAERVAFVLHDVFAVEFDEIATVLDRSPEAVRQLASRGRRRVREREQRRTTGRRAPSGGSTGGSAAEGDAADSGSGDRTEADYYALDRNVHRSEHRIEHRKAVAAFAAACMNGDIPGLMLVLDPDVVWHSDGGGIVRAGAQPVVGAEKVARVLAGIVDRWIGPTADLRMQLAEVNGEPGVLVVDGSGATAGVVAFEVADGRVTHAYAVVNPEKLSRVAHGAISSYLPRRAQRDH